MGVVMLVIFAENGFNMYSLDSAESERVGRWNGVLDTRGRLVSRRRMKAWILQKVAAKVIVRADWDAVEVVLFRYGLDFATYEEYVRNLIQCVLVHWENAACTAHELSDVEMEGRQESRADSPVRPPVFTLDQVQGCTRGQNFAWELPQNDVLLPDGFGLRVPFRRLAEREGYGRPLAARARRIDAGPVDGRLPSFDDL